MPELPELEVIRDMLLERIVGASISAVQLVQPGAAIVVRDLSGLGAEALLTALRFTAVARRGQFLILSGATAHEERYITINPKLTGRLQLADANIRKAAKTHLILTLSTAIELRYIDQKQMGQIYLSRVAPEQAGIPGYLELGPEPLTLSEVEFRQRLRTFQGEIKGILVRNEFIAGIGNAYADEILWEAQIHPYRKRPSLSENEIAALYAAIQHTLVEATANVRAAMGKEIHREPRTFLKVHLQAGKACPRCGGPISEVKANKRITNFCRTCQPGGLIKGL